MPNGAEHRWIGPILRTAVLPLLWVVLVHLMAGEYRVEDWDAFDRDPLPDLVVCSLFELLVLLALLRPWSYQHAWVRPLVAVLLGIPWALITALSSGGGGGMVKVHLLWVLGLAALMVGLTVWSLNTAAEVDEPEPPRPWTRPWF